MSRWWRAYDGAVDHAKLLLLSDRQHRAWFNLMCVVSENGGALPDIKVVAVKLRMSQAKVAGLVAELRDARLFDEVDGQIVPHNWNRRQFRTDVTDPTNADRQQRFRDRHRNGPTTVTPTVTKSVTRGVTAKLPETDTESEKEERGIRERRLKQARPEQVEGRP